MTISRCPGDKLIKATYNASNTTTFQDSVGKTLLEIAHVVPDGMLVFMPSYTMMEKLRQRWNQTGAVFLCKVTSCVYFRVSRIVDMMPICRDLGSTDKGQADMDRATWNRPIRAGSSKILRSHKHPAGRHVFCCVSRQSSFP